MTQSFSRITLVSAIVFFLLLIAESTAFAYEWKTFDGHRYALTEAFGTWEQCEQEAVACGGHLVTINSSDENNWLFSTLNHPSQDFLWIGLNQLPGSLEPREGWQWSSGESLTYLNWMGTSQPDNSSPAEDYGTIVMKDDGRWNDWDHRRIDFHPIQGIIETPISDPPEPDPIDPVDPPIHTSQYNFVLGADPHCQWDGFTFGLNFTLGIPTMDPIVYNPIITYPATPIAPELNPWEIQFSTNNKLLGEALSLVAPVDTNIVELSGTARLSGDVSAFAGVGLGDGTTQADIEVEFGAGVNLMLSVSATNDLFDKLPGEMQRLIPNSFEFTYPIVGASIGIEEKIDHGMGSFNMQLFRETLVAIPDDEYTSVDQLDGAVNIGGVPMIFRDTDTDGVIDYVLAEVGVDFSAGVGTSATADLNVYFFEVDEYGDEVESTSIFNALTNLWNKGVDLLDETVFSSNTGTIEIDEDGLRLQTGSPVWMQTVITLEEETNLLAFSAEFLSEEGAEGILQIFCNYKLVATIDERTAAEGIEEYIFSLPEELGAGECLLAFRLDPFTNVNSSIQIDNITMGYMQIVPEPSMMVMIVAGLIGVFIVPKRGGNQVR